MSCELDCPLSVGVGAGDTSLVSKDTLLHVFEHHNAWLDAKARPLFVVTPKRHVRRLADLRYQTPNLRLTLISDVYLTFHGREEMSMHIFPLALTCKP